MRLNVTILSFLLLIVYTGIFAQAKVGDNCNSPKQVSVSCPTAPVTLPNETTAGYANDINDWYYVGLEQGNDLVYAVTVPPGTGYIVVSVTALSGPFYLISNNNYCQNPYSYSYWHITAPVNNITIPVSGAGPYYIWVDHNTIADITYSISFGLLSGCTYEYIPDTRGNWGFASVCTTPQTKNGLEVTYNGIPKSLPLTYTPLNVPGVVCGDLFLQNTTGAEGVKTMEFTFGPDLINVSPTVTTMPGLYNTGTWNAVQTGNKIIWSFTDAAGLGYGDFTGIQKTCLSYNFCFNITPLSNIKANTNILDSIYPDNRGLGFNGYICGVSCCPSPGSCSPGGAGGGSAGGGGISIGFNDPGVLPVKLVNFSGVNQGGKNLLQWQTASEQNSSFFEVERSGNGQNYTAIATVPAAGNSSALRSYSYTDVAAAAGDIYYRLKQVDKDSAFTYSPVIVVEQQGGSVRLYPNPATTTLAVESEQEILSVAVSSALGTTVTLNKKEGDGGYDVSALATGIYFVLIQFADKLLPEKLVIE